MTRPVVTFLSDFGAGSGYPAQMKGEVLRRLPEATLVDLSHEVPHFDVLAAALLLEACVPRFPIASVHVAVVDPGVGTSRRALCVVDAAGRRLVGPDNGLLSPFLGPGSGAFELAEPALLPRDPSPTFHGRDLFAPAAAFLAGGGDPARLGRVVTDPVRLALGASAIGPDLLEGQCLTSDPFGNVVTSVRREDAAGRPLARVTVGEVEARPVRTFGDGRPGELLALWGSGGRLELCVREDDAARRFSLVRGAPVRVGLA